MIVEVYIHVMQMAARLIFLGNPCKPSVYNGLAAIKEDEVTVTIV